MVDFDTFDVETERGNSGFVREVRLPQDGDSIVFIVGMFTNADHRPD